LRLPGCFEGARGRPIFNMRILFALVLCIGLVISCFVRA
jgi:hypothetical protein